ncbi:hypothetical protein SD81_016970 [Tolypothrix campylonemoides VB511288]|nr:hypothetical protein SD81_016970 [Tolypothrix campylonemoides VB511288]
MLTLNLGAATPRPHPRWLLPFNSYQLSVITYQLQSIYRRSFELPVISYQDVPSQSSHWSLRLVLVTAAGTVHCFKPVCLWLSG